MIRVLSTRIARPINTFAKEQNIIIRSLATGKETYTERQAKKGRPVSPHVTIYAFPAAAISSITNRVTGVVLWGGLTGIGALNLVGCDVHNLMAVMGSITLLGTVTKAGVAFPLVYHYLGGVRHLLWDRNPDMLENDKVEQTSKILMGASAVLSFGIALM